MLEPQTDSGPVATEDDLVTEDLLVEDVSIDGMCGVY
jgi:mycofactocin precursor